MRKSVFVLLIFLAICFGWLGFAEGRDTGFTEGKTFAYNQLSTEVESLLKQSRNNNYHMAITNVLSCILALDSDLIRFLDIPDVEELRQFVARVAQCELFWEVAMEYSTTEEQSLYLSESRWFYDNWLEHINESLETRVKLTVLLQKIEQGDNHLAPGVAGLIEKLTKQKEQLRLFRDTIEEDLMRSW